MAEVKDQGDDAEEPEALYAALNLPVTATQNEIRERYKTLAVLLHPDKQQDEVMKETASRKFHQIHKAYEVLSDPSQRVVYDALGERGLQTEWRVGHKFKSPEEIRAEFDRAAALSLDQTLRPRGRITCSIDAREFLTSDLGLQPATLELTAFEVKHSVSSRINSSTRARLAGRSFSAVGKATRPTIIAMLWHQYSPKLTIQASVAFLRPQSLALKGEYQLDEATMVSMTADFSGKYPRLLPPPIALSITRRLFPNLQTIGTLTLQTGPAPTFTCSLHSPIAPKSQELGWTLQASLSPLPSISGLWSVGGGIPGTRAAIGAELSLPTGPGARLEGEWNGEDNKVAVSVSGGTSGMSLTVTLSRLGQDFVVPIILSDSCSLDLVLFTTIIPTGLFLLANEFILKPQHRARLKRKLQIRKELTGQAVEDAREEAIRVAKVLQATADRKAEAERAKDGLIIIEATYAGHLPDKWGVEGEIRDESEVGSAHEVTGVLQSLVASSQLSIPGGRSKSGMIGFYDPAPTLPKMLKVRYSFRGRMHYVEVKDRAGLVMPLRGWQLMHANDNKQLTTGMYH